MKKAFVETGRKSYSLIEVLLVFFIILLSTITGILIFLDTTRPYHYLWLPILPLSFGLINIFTFKIYYRIFNKVAYLIIIFLYTIRNTITPLIMKFGQYYGNFKILNFEIVNKAIILMIYETFVVFFLLFYLEGKDFKYKKRKKNRNHNIKYKTIPYGVFFLIIIICIFAYFTVPEIKLNYVSIFNEGEKIVGKIGAIEILPIGTYKRSLYTLFSFIFNISQIFLSIWIIVKIKKIVGDTFLGVIISIIIIFSNFLFITGETGYTFVVIAILCICSFKIFFRNGLKLLICVGFIFSIALIYIYINKANMMISKVNNAVTASAMLQAYFPGVCNIAGIFNIINNRKMTTLFYDIYAMIPFRNTLFGLNNDERLVLLYTEQNRALYNILPCIGQACHYISIIFAPLIPGLFVYLAVRTQRKLRNISNIWQYSSYLLLCIYTSLTPIMYNATIFGARFFSTILPMIIIAKYTNNNIIALNNRFNKL